MMTTNVLLGAPDNGGLSIPIDVTAITPKSNKKLKSVGINHKKKKMKHRLHVRPKHQFTK